MIDPRDGLSIEEAASEDDVAAVRQGLLSFNERQIGPSNEQPVRLVVRAATGAVIAGLLGATRWGWLHVDKLWLSDETRGQRIGSRLMARAEAIALERGCVGATLHTFEHQARPFYEKLGYELFGTLEGYPAGTRQHYLFKRLDPTSPPLAQDPDSAHAFSSITDAGRDEPGTPRR
jgi:GNAT superfamily N-acetyltransferase